MAQERLLKTKVIVYIETTESTIDKTFTGENAMEQAEFFFRHKMKKLRRTKTTLKNHLERQEKKKSLCV